MKINTKRLIDLDLYRYKNVVFGTVLNTDEKLLSKGKLISLGDYYIKSLGNPLITKCGLFVHDKSTINDKQSAICYAFSNEDEAINWVENIKVLLCKLEKTYAEDINNITKVI